MKMIKLRVSGSFKTVIASDKDRMNFENVEIVMPYCDEEYYIQHAQRMFPIFVKKVAKYAKMNYEGLIKLYVDEETEASGKPLCIGKNIKEMTWEELQSMACYFKIREIPLYKSGDLRKARERAYELHEEKVTGRRVFKSDVDLAQFRERVKQEGLRRMLTNAEIEKEVSDRLENALMMIVDKRNPHTSYNFAKLPAIVIPDPEPKEERNAVQGEKEGDEEKGEESEKSS